MIFDQTNLFSDRQEITASAASTHVVDAGPIAPDYGRNIGNGASIPLAIQVVEAFTAAGAGTLTVELQVSDTEDFASSETIATTIALGKAALIPGYMIPITMIGRGANKRFSRLYYKVASGPMTSGKIMAGVVAGLYTHG